MVKFNKFQASLVKLSWASSVEVLIADIVSFVNENIKKQSPDKIDPSLLRFICNIVENSYNKKDVVDKKINKKKIVLDVYVVLKPQCNNLDDKNISNYLIKDFHTSEQILIVSGCRNYYKLIKNQVFLKKE